MKTLLDEHAIRSRSTQPHLKSLLDSKDLRRETSGVPLQCCFYMRSDACKDKLRTTCMSHTLTSSQLLLPLPKHMLSENHKVQQLNSPLLPFRIGWKVLFALTCSSFIVPAWPYVNACPRKPPPARSPPTFSERKTYHFLCPQSIVPLPTASSPLTRRSPLQDVSLKQACHY